MLDTTSQDATLRYAGPAPELSDLVSGYQIFVAPGAPGMRRTDRLLPGIANVRVALGADPVAVRIGKRRFDPLPSVALIGPTTCAPQATSGAGVLVAFGVTPLGWARLFRRSATTYADRIVPLGDATGPALPRALQAELASDPEDLAAVKAVLDRLLGPLLATPGPDEREIRAVAAAVADPAVAAVADLVARTGLGDVRIRRLCERYFGMTPKLLLRRARFLRSFLDYFGTDGADGYAAIDPGYHDASHFLRDADRFLGTTPRRFIAEATTFLEASVRARAAALGASTCVLQPTGAGAPA